MKKSILLLFVAAFVILVAFVDNRKNEQENASNATLGKNPYDTIKGLRKTVAELDKQYKADLNGQWVDKTEASSSYAGYNRGKQASWSADQMIGEPDVTSYGDNGAAWASMSPDGGEEWVKLSFKKPVFATEIRVRMTYNPGAISKIEVFNQQGVSEVVWQGVDKQNYNSQMDYFVATFPKTKYATSSVKITLNSKAYIGWNEIDAVQIVGTEK